MHAHSKARQGFTLVEILIVVVILGILAAIVIPQFTSASEDARASSLVSQLQTIRSQMELYQIQNNGNYPTITGTDWDAMTIRDETNNTGPYLQQAPRNPFGPGDTASVTVVDGLTELNAHNATNWNYDPNTGQIKANLNLTEDQANDRNLNFSDADVNYEGGGGT